MVNADVVSSPKRSQISSKKHRPLLLLRWHWDLLAVLLLVLGSFPTVWLLHRTVTLVPNLGLIDDSWQLDSPFKALRGIWIGRDVAFTHGPIYQWLQSIPAFSMPLSFGGLYETRNTLPLWCAVVFMYAAIRLVLPEQPPWKRFFLLLLTCSFWDVSLRTALPMLMFALFLRGWDAVRDGRLRPVIAGMAGALLCVVAFLVAGDTGMYTTAAWLICLAAFAFEARRGGCASKLLQALASFAIASAVFVIVTNCFMATPFDFKFWRESLAQISVYRWATPAAMTPEGTIHLLGGLLIGAIVFGVRVATRAKPPTVMAQRTAFLLAGFVFALVEMQSGLVRSDIGHVRIGNFGMIFFASVILFSFRRRIGSIAGVLVVAAACMLFSRPMFRPSSVMRLYWQLRYPMTACPWGYHEYDQACYVEPLTPQMLTAGANFLSAHSGANDSVFVFPYQTMLGVAARRNVAGGLMQAYTASGPYLSRLEIAGLEGKPIPAALYFPDDDYHQLSPEERARWSRNYLSVPVDGIPNFTRIPEVWFWMVRRYRAAGELMPGVVGLQRDDARAARVLLQGQSLGLPLRTYAIDARRSVTDLGYPAWPADFDFIRLRLKVNYGIWWKLRKPERLQLEITRADGTRDVQWFLVQPNVATDLWFYPWQPSDLAHYFDSDENQWRLGTKSAIANLRIIATPLDWVSLQPESITVEAADAVRMTMGQR